MPAPSSINQLPSEVKSWLDQELKDRNFAQYSDLEAALNAKLADHDLELTISRSALGRYGQQRKQAQEQLLRSIEMAKSLTEVGDDQADMLGQANTAMAQSSILELQIKAQELADSKPEDLKGKASLIRGLVHAASDIARASTNQKKWASEVNQRIAKASAEAEQIAQKGGLSTQNVALIREALTKARL